MSKNIRAVQVAQHIGISTQELRKFIGEVNFGVRPADREFPEGIANGIVRYVARRLKKDIAPLVLTEEFEEEVEAEEEVQEGEKTVKKESVIDRLSKLAQQSRNDKSDKEKAEKAKAEKEKAEKSQKGKSRAIFRKIEISPEATAKAKKEADSKPQKSKEEREKEEREKRAFEQKKKDQIFVKKEGVVVIPESVSVKEFSEKIGIPPSKIISALMKNGIMVTINNALDFDTCAIVADELNVEVKKEEFQASTEDLFAKDLSKILGDDKENLVQRPPVIAVMGHVDHGKTKILDAIRKSNVADKEAGGITQKIGAHQVVKNGQLITFLDTPGHEAFTAMRARGARTADIAILVVAADEGIKPQTVEAINHAKEAGVSIVVAINKIDRPSANIDKVKGELANHDLNPEDWGGDTICVPVSGLTGEGIDGLLESILLVSEMLELKANPKRLAVGTVIESHLDESLGHVATILVNTGTLKVADNFIVGHVSGKIKSMVDDEGKRVKKSSPSDAVQISGFSGGVSAGEILQVFPSKKIVKQKLDELSGFSHEEKGVGAGVGEIMDMLKMGKMKFLKVVLKADTNGSLEAIRQELEKIKHDEVGVKIIHAGVGSPTESDVLMATASMGVVVGFNIRISPRVKRIAEQEKIELKNFNIIFELTDTIKKIVEGLLEPEEEEIITGRAIAKQIFWSKGRVLIVGCKVEKGYIEKGSSIRVFRGEEQTGKGKAVIIQHFEKKVDKIDENQECGIQFEGKGVSIEVGDILEGFKIEKTIKTL